MRQPMFSAVLTGLPVILSTRFVPGSFITTRHSLRGTCRPPAPACWRGATPAPVLDGHRQHAGAVPALPRLPRVPPRQPRLRGARAAVREQDRAAARARRDPGPGGGRPLARGEGVALRAGKRAASNARTTHIVHTPVYHAQRFSFWEGTSPLGASSQLVPFPAALS